MRKTQLAFSDALINRFWNPFTVGVTGPDIQGYRFREALETLADPTFTGGKWLGKKVTSLLDVENQLVVLLSGFDIFVKYDPLLAPKTIRLVHCRRFLGWHPNDQVSKNTYEVPFTMSITASKKDLMKDLKFDAPFHETLKKAGCPEPVFTCLNLPEAMDMMVTLRRARVPPQLITHQALLSVEQKKPDWMRALQLS